MAGSQAVAGTVVDLVVVTAGEDWVAGGLEREAAMAAMSETFMAATLGAWGGDVSRWGGDGGALRVGRLQK